ncbi:enoyl-CoA hydratase [Halomonas eurihalina]|uniref:Enoyl-CoA hydratase n=1 Tax=Halomonas eurihalina TaxID=42566 RepID=A0A5D9D6R1_HALER|nr:enoyl-CoA hydratase [Halomonas eurihalina]MDR5858824.1 enoyl-CoA hydratase [Halomonas eurihalina]TZG38962.1 enoyl-CoA hydratase [Halomonas eurihalina]
MGEIPPYVQAQLSEGVLELTLNRPERRNALSADMYTELACQLQFASQDQEVRVVLLTGAGEAFTAGSDIDGFETSAKDRDTAPARAFIEALIDCEKPIVAAVNGVAVGIGVTLLLHCDLVYSADCARFRLPFVNLGLVPEAGSSLLLPRLMGFHRATELLLMGDWFEAHQAERFGLVGEVFDTVALMSQVRARARHLAAQPSEAVWQTRRLLRTHRTELRECVEHELATFNRLLDSVDAREARLAFREKRPPRFR